MLTVCSVESSDRVFPNSGKNRPPLSRLVKVLMPLAAIAFNSPVRVPRNDTVISPVPEWLMLTISRLSVSKILIAPGPVLLMLTEATFVSMAFVGVPNPVTLFTTRPPVGALMSRAPVKSPSKIPPPVEVREMADPDVLDEKSPPVKVTSLSAVRVIVPPVV